MTPAELARASLQCLVGKAPWDVRLGVGSMITMEFGQRDPRQSVSTIHGEWHLWLCMCSWRIESENTVVIACEDDRERIRRTIAAIPWSEVAHIELQLPALDLQIRFANGEVLRTFSVSSIESDANQWILFTPELKSITARGNGFDIEAYAADKNE